MEVQVFYIESRRVQVCVQLRRQSLRHGQHFEGQISLLRDLIPAELAAADALRLLTVQVVPAPVVAVVRNVVRVVVSVNL